MTTYTYLYLCARCGHTGSDQTTNKTDAASPSAKHAKACGGTVLTGTDPAALGRMVEAVGRA